MRTSHAALPRVPAPARPRLRLASRAGARAPGPLVVVGNGMVGHRLCRRLVALGATERRRIVVFGEEPIPAYDRVHLTDHLAAPDEDGLLLAPERWYEDHGIELRLADPVVSIDRGRYRVRSASGFELGYERLVLATGSSSYVPPIEGAGQSGVFTYRTIGDLQAIREHARLARTAAVIGGGLLGLESARALQRLGLGITIIEAAGAVMSAQLDRRASEELQRQIAALGIRILTGTITTRITPDERRRTLHFGGGGEITVDLVVIAAGIRPRSQLAADCGLTRAGDGGIVVDDFLRTSDPAICAIGECASHRSRTYGLLSPGYAMADALAVTLTGGKAAFQGADPATTLKLLEVDVVTAGDPSQPGVALRFRREGVYRLLRVDRGRLVGAVGIGEWDGFTRVQDTVARRRHIWPWQVRRFLNTGTPWRPRGQTPVTAWPKEVVVCRCLTVTRGDLAAACAGAPPTLKALVEATGASTVCGSCRPLLVQLAGAGAGEPAGTARGLLVTSALALAAAMMVLIAAPVPFAASVQGPVQLDVLWRNHAYREITGFTLLGLSAAAAVLTIRKRWPRVGLGTFPAWRLVHVTVGLLTIVTLAVHTGLRTGHNLNFALMACFSALSVLGALAGGVTAVEQKLGAGAGRRYRAALVLGHILAIWPLPLLIAFHVLAVYYF